jgi:hypothetical protein
LAGSDIAFQQTNMENIIVIVAAAQAESEGWVARAK